MRRLPLRHEMGGEGRGEISPNVNPHFGPLNPTRLLTRPAATLSSILNGGEGKEEEVPRVQGEGF